MPISSHELVCALLDELVTIREIISRSSIDTLGRPLTPPQREAAINARLGAAAEVSALIANVCRYGNHPVICPHTGLRAAAPVIRGFPSGSYRVETAEEVLTGAYADRDDVHGHNAGQLNARNSAVHGPGRRVRYGLPRRRRNAGERRMMLATAYDRSGHDDRGP
jgi:hypothetical protein